MCLARREETGSVGNQHPVLQLVSMVFLILQDRDESLQTAQVAPISRCDFHTSAGISALLHLAGSSSHSTAVFNAASFQGEAGVGTTTHGKQERDLILEFPA